MDFILSFNFSHTVGAEAKFARQTAIAKMGYRPLLLAAAEDLFEVLWNKPTECMVAEAPKEDAPAMGSG